MLPQIGTPEHCRPATHQWPRCWHGRSTDQRVYPQAHQSCRVKPPHQPAHAAALAQLWSSMPEAQYAHICSMVRYHVHARQPTAHPNSDIRLTRCRLASDASPGSAAAAKRQMASEAGWCVSRYCPGGRPVSCRSTADSSRQVMAGRKPAPAALSSSSGAVKCWLLSTWQLCTPTCPTCTHMPSPVSQARRLQTRLKRIQRE